MAFSRIAYTDFFGKMLTLDSGCGRELLRVPLPIQPLCVLTFNDIAITGGTNSLNYLLHQLCVVDLCGKVKQTLTVPACPTVFSAFDDATEQFACGFRDGTVAVYSFKDDMCSKVAQFDAARLGITSLVWLGRNMLCVGGNDGSIASWNTTNASLEHTYQNFGTPISSLCAIPNNNAVIFSGHSDGTLRMFQDCCETVELTPHQDAINGLALTEDKSSLLTCSWDHDVVALDAVTLEEKWRFTCEEGATSLCLLDAEVAVGVYSSNPIALELNDGSLARQFSTKHDGWMQVASNFSPFDGLFSKFQFVD